MHLSLLERIELVIGDGRDQTSCSVFHAQETCNIIAVFYRLSIAARRDFLVDLVVVLGVVSLRGILALVHRVFKKVSTVSRLLVRASKGLKDQGGVGRVGPWGREVVLFL